MAQMGPQLINQLPQLILLYLNRWHVNVTDDVDMAFTVLVAVQLVLPLLLSAMA